jgi:Ice-binding-like
MLWTMIRTFYASVRLPLVAPLAALIFSGCSGAELQESSSTDPMPSNTASAETTPASPNASTAASSNANTAASSDPSTYSYNTNPSDSENAPSDNEAASDTDAAADARVDSPPDSGTELVQQGAPAISLGAAEGFALLGGATVTCTNSSAVTGDVGVSPGIAITGFDASCTLSGAIHAQDAAATAAHADLLIAFDELGAAECGTDLTGVELGGLTLAPGVYCFDTTAGVTGGLTLDAGGDSNASWIFKVGSAITTGPGSTMTMAGGGDACNVFWQVGTSASLGTTSSFKGNILASASISLTSGSSLEGSAMALVGAVTSDNNVISNCGR